jgi:RNA-binding protein
LLTGKQKSYLRSLANTLEPIIQVGKGGVTETVTTAVDQALIAREIVKISVLNNCHDPLTVVAQDLVKATDSFLVQQLGRKILLYRPNQENPVIQFPLGN